MMRTTVKKHGIFVESLLMVTLLAVLALATTCNGVGPETLDYTPPVGKGAMQVNFNLARARSILPGDLTLGNIAVFVLDISPSPKDGWSPMEIPGTGNNNPVGSGYIDVDPLPPVTLPATFTVEVLAYLDAGKTQLVAGGTATQMVTVGETASVSVTLDAINNSGQGTFSWDIDISDITPGTISSAEMAITPISPGGTPAATHDFLDAIDGIGWEDQATLNSGYYYVDFDITINGSQVIFRHVLHIYQNMKSHFHYALTDAYFTVTGQSLTVTIIEINPIPNVPLTLSDGNNSNLDEGAKVTLSAASPPQTATITVTNAGDYNGGVNFYIGNTTPRAGPSITITAGTAPFVKGLYQLTAVGIIDGVPYSKYISIEIVGDAIMGRLSSIADIIAYLEAQTGGVTTDDPVPLPVELDLGTMTNANSNWQQMLEALATVGKYVELDLSTCTMTGTAFNPDYNVATGKDRIVSIALPDTAISITAGFGTTTPAFRYFAALESFSGEELTSIGNWAFYGCTNLALTELPAGIASIGSVAFYGCTSLALEELPEGILSIGNSAFEGCTSLALTELPEGLTSIDSAAFRDCTSLALTELPEGIVSIGNDAFYNCTSLVLTELPEGITSIGSSAFQYCTNLALTELPAGITSIGDSTFWGCTNLALTELPAGIISIGNYAFYNCTNLALEELPEGIASIGNNAFSGCTSLALTELPAGIASIGFSTFYGCTSLALTELPEGITSIGGSAFQNCVNLALTFLPAGLISIGGQAFQQCANLFLIELPEVLTSIGNRAFTQCTNLATVTCYATTPPELGVYVFSDTSANLEIKVPAGSVEAYKEAPGWIDYETRIVPIE
jgi:hypothetical protein